MSSKIPCEVTWKTTNRKYPHNYHRCKKFIIKGNDGVLKGHQIHQCKCGAIHD